LEGGEREREISSMAFASVITGEIFELICTYLHFAGTESIPTYKDLANFSKFILCYII
jgi:hypothetical protein